MHTGIRTGQMNIGGLSLQFISKITGSPEVTGDNSKLNVILETMYFCIAHFFRKTLQISLYCGFGIISIKITGFRIKREK